LDSSVNWSKPNSFGLTLLTNVRVRLGGDAADHLEQLDVLGAAAELVVADQHANRAARQAGRTLPRRFFLNN